MSEPENEFLFLPDFIQTLEETATQLRTIEAHQLADSLEQEIKNLKAYQQQHEGEFQPSNITADQLRQWAQEK